MIKIKHTDTYGWQAAIRGMRNPMNSWSLSDSSFKGTIEIGANDLKLMQQLAKAGNDHGKFLRMINVTADITAPLYWWSEYDTYKIGTVANSCSKMHKLTARHLTLDDFSIDENTLAPELFCNLITLMNALMNLCNSKDKETTPEMKKQAWRTLIQIMPNSYNQKRTVQLNYAVLKNMYHARKNHKLEEWREFCRWVEKLPYAAELIIEN